MIMGVLAMVVTLSQAVGQVSYILVTNDVSSGTSSNTTYTGTSGGGSGDKWNVPGNWDFGVPASALSAVIPDKASAFTVAATSATIPPYSGDLTIGSNVTLQIGWASGSQSPACYNALGTPGSTTIHMGPNSMVKNRNYRGGANWDVPAVILYGAATFKNKESTEGVTNPTFDYPVTGSHPLTLQFGTCTFNASNSFSALTGEVGSTVKGTVAGSLGTGDVTINDTAKLVIDAADAMADTATLSLNIPTSGKVTMNGDDAVGTLTIGGFPYPAGTYGRVGTPGTASNEVSWISGNSVLTVLSDSGDVHDPTTFVITDDSVNGETFMLPAPTVTFTLTFNEPGTFTGGAGDVVNSGSAAISVDSVTQVSETTVVIDVTASSIGTLQVTTTGATSFEDVFGNTLNGPFADDSTIAVHDASVLIRPLGILNLEANSGVNPATGSLWKNGDTYRFIFASSVMTNAIETDIEWYNDYVQGLADASPLGIGSDQGATWKIAASSSNVSARANTLTDPAEHGEAIFLLNGSSLVATNYADLWNGLAPSPINVSETGGSPAINTQHGDTWTGSQGNGTIHSSQHLGAANVMCGLWPHTSGAHWFLRWSGTNTAVRPVYGLSMPLTLGTTYFPGSVLIIR